MRKYTLCIDKKAKILYNNITVFIIQIYAVWRVIYALSVLRF